MEIHNTFLDYTEQQFDRVIGVDLKGAFFCAQALPARWSSKTAGRIINISSVHEDIAMPNTPIAVPRGDTYDDPHHLYGPTSRSTTLHRERFLRQLMLMWRQIRRSWKRFLPKFPCIAGGSLKRSGNWQSSWLQMQQRT